MEPEKELDLIDLLKLLGNSIGKGISAISRFIMWFIKFCVKNWYILLVSVAFGIACAFYFSQSKFSKYEGIIVVENNVESTPEFYTEVQSLASYMNNDNTSFSSKFGVSTEIGKKIFRLEPLYIYTSEDEGLYNFIDEKKKYSDLEPHQQKFAILIKTNDRSLFPFLKTALYKYFENHPYFKGRNVARLNFLDVQQRTLQNEIATLDSLKKLEYFEANSKTKNLKMDNALLIGESNTQLYHTNILEMMEKLQRTKIDIETRNSVVTISSDFQIKSPQNARVKSLVLFGSAFFVIGFCLALFIRHRNKIKEFLK
ncbi:MAG: cytochrome c biogenesis protein ResB [Bacteroidales bacterium]|nr:cytochrome c biogenesis protein ResB [Bacteroidales bacterium]